VPGAIYLIIAENSARPRRTAAELASFCRRPLPYHAPGIPPDKETAMAKGQKRSNREARKPKAEKGPKKNASNPTTKPGGLGTVETIKTR
jgi:hypothetical protein